MINFNKFIVLALGTALTSIVLSACTSSEEIKENTSKDGATVFDLKVETGISNDFSYEKVDNEITLKKYKGNDKIVNIPSEIESAVVTTIDSHCFENISHKDSVNSVIIPSSIENISTLAFYNSNFLDSIECDDNLNYVSENGILYTSDMSNLIAYPENKKESEYILPSTVSVISNNAFSYCKNLKKVTTSPMLKIIPDYTFAYNKEIEEVIIADGVEDIGFASFYKCSNLKSLTLPNTVKNINENAIILCDNLNIIKMNGENENVKNYVENVGIKYVVK